MKLTLAKVLARKYQVVLYLTLPSMSADNLCKQSEPNQARQNVGPDLDPNFLKLRMVLKKSSIQRVKYGTIKCEGIIKAVFINPKADQNTLFHKYVIFSPRLYF